MHASDYKSGSALLLCAASHAQCYVQELPLGPMTMCRVLGNCCARQKSAALSTHLLLLFHLRCLQELPLGPMAVSLGLLKLPRMPEVKKGSAFMLCAAFTLLLSSLPPAGAAAWSYGHVARAAEAAAHARGQELPSIHVVCCVHVTVVMFATCRSCR
jgi:hypothetical protein